METLCLIFDVMCLSGVSQAVSEAKKILATIESLYNYQLETTPLSLLRALARPHGPCQAVQCRHVRPREYMCLNFGSTSSCSARVCTEEMSRIESKELGTVIVMID